MIADRQKKEAVEEEEGARAGQESTSRCFVAGPVSSSSPYRRLLSHSRIRDPERLRIEERRSSIRDTGRTHDSDPLSGSGLYRAIIRLAIGRSSKMIRRNNDTVYQSIVIE